MKAALHNRAAGKAKFEPWVSSSSDEEEKTRSRCFEPWASDSDDDSRRQTAAHNLGTHSAKRSARDAIAELFEEPQETTLCLSAPESACSTHRPASAAEPNVPAISQLGQHAAQNTAAALMGNANLGTGSQPLEERRHNPSLLSSPTCVRDAPCAAEPNTSWVSPLSSDTAQHTAAPMTEAELGVGAKALLVAKQNPTSLSSSAPISKAACTAGHNVFSVSRFPHNTHNIAAPNIDMKAGLNVGAELLEHARKAPCTAEPNIHVR